MAERWKPEYNDEYFLVICDGKVECANWDDCEFDQRCFAIGNCFKTKAAAQSAAIKVRDLLLSLHHGVATELLAKAGLVEAYRAMELNRAFVKRFANNNELQASIQDKTTSIQDKLLPKLTAEVFDRPDCPKWAQWAAVDKYRNAMWYEGEPKVVGSVFWNSQRGQIQKIPGKFDASDWQNSLIERPKNRVNWDEVEEICCNSKLTFKEKKQELPDWCNPGEWIYTSSEQYLKINCISIDLQKIELSNGANWSKQDIIDEAVSARLRPYNSEEMRGLVGKVICGSEGKRFLVVAYSGNTVLFGDFLHTPEDLTLDIYKFPNGSPCGVLEHLEEGEWVK